MPDLLGKTAIVTGAARGLSAVLDVGPAKQGARIVLADITEVPDYPAGGPSVHHFAAPGEVTLARLARKEGRYWLAVVPGRIVEFDRESALARGRTVTPQWPIAFTKLTCGADEFLSRFPCNHIHGVYGDCTKELLAAGKILGIQTRLFGSTEKGGVE